MLGMPKALCMSGIAVAILIILLFGVDLAVALPFKRASAMMDISLISCAIVLGLISWMTLREQG
jgi:hypothetical protein